MPGNSYGIIVEGTYDSAVYETIIRRVASHAVQIKPRPCGGRTNLLKEFPGLLRTFEHAIDGNPVDMAIVIRDADGKDATQVEDGMRLKIAHRQYPFPLGVRCYAVSQAMDAWLLADANAISSAVQRRRGRRVTRSIEAPEGLLRPKESFRQLLTDHGADYTAELCREIAEEIDLEVLSQRCPRFRVFADLVDC